MPRKIPEALETRFADFDHVINTRLYAYRRWCRDHGVSYTTYEVFCRLIHVGEEGSTPSELADDFMIPRQTMTGMLDNLEHAGMIERESDPSDRRRKRVRLTPQGIDYVHELLGDVHESEIDAYETLTREEQDELERLMLRYISALERELSRSK